MVTANDNPRSDAAGIARITSNPALVVGSHPETLFMSMPSPLIPLYRDPYPID